MAIQITQGTQTSIYTKLNAGTEIGVVKLDIGSGTAIQDFGGTIIAVNNVASGTLAAITSLVKGTVSTGTIDSISQLPPNSWGTTVNVTTNTLGTIKTAVSGSQIFVTDLIISVGSASNVTIGNGAAANNIAGTFYLALNGGLTANFRVPIATSAGSSLTYQQSTSGGPLSITAYGFVR